MTDLPQWVSKVLAMGSELEEIEHELEEHAPWLHIAQIDADERAQSYRDIATKLVARGDEHSLQIALMLAARARDEATFWRERVAADGRATTPTLEQLLTIARSGRVAVGEDFDTIAAQEYADAVRAADDAGDWGTLARLLNDTHGIRCNDMCNLAIRAIAAVSLDRFVTDIADRCVSTVDAVGLANALPRRDALDAASRSTSQFFRFAAALTAVQPPAELGEEDVDHLLKLLRQSAQDTVTWEGWMRAFNRYPVRFPLLQEPLGRILASAPDEAVASYVAAIDLSTSPGSCAEQVLRCLQAFEREATEGRRLHLSRLAYERWDEWDFGDGDLHEIAGSELDAAIIDWLQNGDASGRAETLLDAALHALRALDWQWHDSLGDLRSKRLRTLSRLQIYAQALDGPTAKVVERDGMFLPAAEANPYALARHWSRT